MGDGGLLSLRHIGGRRVRRAGPPASFVGKFFVLDAIRVREYHFFVMRDIDSELNGRENASPKKRKVLSLHLHHLDIVCLADFPYHLFRSFPDLFPFEYLLPVFWAPDQMVARVVDRMTRPSQRHPFTLANPRARAYVDKGNFPVPLITPSERHEFIPSASRGVFFKGFR